MIPRSQALKHLAALRTDEIVLTAMMAVRQWAAFSDHQLDFSTIGTGMGHASDIGLGLALAQPDRRVIVLNGDGSMLMNLGQLSPSPSRRRRISSSWCCTTAPTK